MSEQTSQEPTMEEILASIRRIISEDEPSADAAAETEAAAEVAPEAGPEPEPAKAAEEPAPEPAPPSASESEPVAAAAAPVAEDEDDALELTQKVETHGDLDVLEAPPAAEPPSSAPPSSVSASEALVSEPAASAAASAFGALSAAILMPRSDRTLEDVVRELLRPLLQQWLDNNLPGIVQQAVQAEVERIARGRVR
jgi:cell pole-organizing protein PopZ